MSSYATWIINQTSCRGYMERLLALRAKGHRLSRLSPAQKLLGVRSQIASTVAYTPSRPQAAFQQLTKAPQFQALEKPAQHQLEGSPRQL